MHEASGLGGYKDMDSVPEGVELPENLIEKYEIDDEQIKVLMIHRGTREGQPYGGEYTYDTMMHWFTTIVDDGIEGSISGIFLYKFLYNRLE